jgi:nucleoside phosphorylase
MQRADFTIGWICALPHEIAASKAILDHEYEPPADVPDARDGSTIVWGKIGDHNVVMACPPPGVCIKPNVSVAIHLLNNLVSLRFCLLVGVGGGIPSANHDIRLGDVVVSIWVR